MRQGKMLQYAYGGCPHNSATMSVSQFERGSCARVPLLTASF
jgi:hypothetical protein